MTAVDVQGLTVAYGGHVVLRDVALAVPEAEFVSIVGPSGCGKSSFLRAVAGLLRPAAGEIFRFGQRAHGCGRDVGFLFQEDALLPWRTAVENVALGLRFRGLPVPAAHREAREWLGRLGLADFADHYPHELSGGMKKRVALAQVLAPRPRLVLMDEPFGSLDAIVRMTLQDDFLTLARAERLTVVLVTHDLEEALLLSDRVALMSAGPGSAITHTYAVPFSHPRHLMRLRAHPGFGRLLQELWDHLRTEVVRSGWMVPA